MGENTIERVARIIDPQAWRWHDDYLARADMWAEKGQPDDHALVGGYRKAASEIVMPSLAKARAAIAALREPSDAMIEAGEMCDAADVWRSMIDAILSLSTPVVGGEEELERLRSLCKENNDLARMYGADRKRLMAENTRLKDAIEYAHSQGFDWPFDPLADPHTTDRAGMAQEVE